MTERSEWIVYNDEETELDGKVRYVFHHTSGIEWFEIDDGCNEEKIFISGNKFQAMIQAFRACNQ